MIMDGLAARMFAVALGAALVARQPANAAEDIVVGFAVAQSGPVEGYDDNGTKMAQVFIDDLNAKGGLLGRKVRAVFADTKSDRAMARRRGRRSSVRVPIS
jgi:branched-chain amino acid transport system substrate-binding protein